MNHERSNEFENPDDRPGKRELSLLEAFDLVLASIPPDDRNRSDLFLIRAEIAAQEETIGEAQQMIEKLEQVIKKVTSPANRIGTYLSNPARETAHIVVGGADYYCNVDPRISLSKLQKGTRVLVNEAYVIVGDLGFDTAGPVTKITEVIGMEQDVITLQDLFVFKQLGIDVVGKTCGEFAATGIASHYEPRFRARGVLLPAELFRERVL